LGERSVRARSVFVRDDRNARSAVGAFDAYRRGVFYSGEALYRGRDVGSVEAALASGLETARETPPSTAVPGHNKSRNSRMRGAALSRHDGRSITGYGKILEPAQELAEVEGGRGKLGNSHLWEGHRREVRRRGFPGSPPLHTLKCNGEYRKSNGQNQAGFQGFERQFSLGIQRYKND
jgi:hypothetical protein